jgi:hypothetical protein
LVGKTTMKRHLLEGDRFPPVGLLSSFLALISGFDWGSCDVT